jgi:hypothetical protein
MNSDRAKNLTTHFGAVTLDAKGYPDQKGILYAPTEAYFDRSWPLPDIAKVN